MAQNSVANSRHVFYSTCFGYACSEKIGPLLKYRRQEDRVIPVSPALADDFFELTDNHRVGCAIDVGGGNLRIVARAATPGCRLRVAAAATIGVVSRAQARVR